MLFHVCTCCEQAKILCEFRTRFRNGYHQYRSWCKSCESKKGVEWSRKKLEQDQDYKKQSLKRLNDWGVQNRGRRQKRDAERRKEKYSNDPDYRAKVCSAASSNRSRRSNSKNLSLSEKHQQQIATIYKTCAKISQSTGKPHEVDHIVPLLGENVCGLHVPWNLAIIPRSMNRSKNNAFPNWGDDYLNS